MKGQSVCWQGELGEGGGGEAADTARPEGRMLCKPVGMHRVKTWE